MEQLYMVLLSAYMSRDVPMRKGAWSYHNQLLFVPDYGKSLTDCIIKLEGSLILSQLYEGVILDDGVQQ